MLGRWIAAEAARAGKRVVYSTDSEHRLEDEGARVRFVEFFQGADAVMPETDDLGNFHNGVIAAAYLYNEIGLTGVPGNEASVEQPSDEPQDQPGGVS